MLKDPATNDVVNIPLFCIFESLKNCNNIILISFHEARPNSFFVDKEPATSDVIHIPQFCHV